MILTYNGFGQGDTVNTIPFNYQINTETLDIIISPIGWTVNQHLLTIHYYDENNLRTYYVVGDNWFPVNLKPVTE